jgi:hypothetical protein
VWPQKGSEGEWLSTINLAITLVKATTTPALLNSRISEFYNSGLSKYPGSKDSFCPVYYDRRRSKLRERNIPTDIFYAFYFFYHLSKQSANENIC